MKKLISAIALSMSLTACGWFDSESKTELGAVAKPTTTPAVVLKSEYDKVVGERDALQTRVKTLESQKPETVVTGLTPQQCSAMAENIVAKSCTAKPPKQVAKAPQTPATATGCPGSCPPPPVTLAPPSAPVPSVGAFWGWIHPEANVANKRTCFADRQITGMPIQCSSVQVFPRVGNETEQQWNARVAAHNGIAVGVKTEKGTITGTQFGRIEVK